MFPVGRSICLPERQNRRFSLYGRAHIRGGRWERRSLCGIWKKPRKEPWLRKKEDARQRRSMNGKVSSALNYSDRVGAGEHPVCPQFSPSFPQFSQFSSFRPPVFQFSSPVFPGFQERYIRWNRRRKRRFRLTSQNKKVYFSSGSE